MAMDKIEIRGGGDLHGTIRVSGAKNAALPIMAAALLARGCSLIENIPRLRDVETMLGILRRLGVKGGFVGPNSLELDCAGRLDPVAPYDLVRKMRASVLVLGPLLARGGRAVVSLPGGCVIGPRPVGLHLSCLHGLGADVKVSHGYIEAETPGLSGGEVQAGGPGGPSVGATINSLLAATGAEGTTTIRQAAREPEVVDTAFFLQAMGARIEGVGSETIVVEGGHPLSPTQYRIIPDRIEAGTYLLAGALAGRDLRLEGAEPPHLTSLLSVLEKTGIPVTQQGGGLQVNAGPPQGGLTISTAAYPGFPTDMQAQVTVLLSLAAGESRIEETVFPDRFMHVPELNRLGADILVKKANAIIRGVPGLAGAPVMASDLRASAALVLAGLVAEGTTTIRRIYHLDRGYERMVEKLQTVGARIKRIKD